MAAGDAPKGGRSEPGAPARPERAARPLRHQTAPRIPAAPAAAPARSNADPTLIPPLGSARFLEQVNHGDLERRLDERQRDPHTWNRIPWRLVLIGIGIGLVFSIVNVYAVLSAGLVVGGSFYVTYFIGMLARWKPGVINYVGGASTGASQVVIGVAFVLPALFLLSDRGDEGAGLLAFDALPSSALLAAYFLIGGLYGVLFFQFYRHLWVVERPLPYPGGFDSTMELLALGGANERRERQRVRKSVFVLTVAGLISAFFVILRDLRAFGPAGGRQPFLDDLVPTSWRRVYSGGVVPNTAEFRPLFNSLFYLDPFLLAIGWFVRSRIALVLLLGSLVTFVLPFFDRSIPSDAGALAYLLSWGGARTTLGAGAILGAGVFALFRLRHTLWSGVRSLMRRFGDGSAHRGRRPVVLAVAVLGGGWLVGSVLLVAGGADIGGALLVVPVGIALVAILGLIGVKVTGETAVQPVSPLTILALLALLGLLQVTGFSGGALIILALGAAAFFATGLIMATDVFLDSKIALYVDNPPHRQALVQVAGLVPGVLLGTALVWYLSGLIVPVGAADVETTLSAPVAFAFTGITGAFTGGGIQWDLFLIAFVLGAFVELATGLGTAFGIGMVLQLFVPFTIFVGAMVRAVYERLAPGGHDERGVLVRVAGPTGVFVGASLAAVLVFVLNQWWF